LIDSAVILAVSASAHRSQLTENRPKAMLPALGKPMVVRVMERLYRAGIRQYYVIVGINEGAVASYLNKQWKPDAKIEFILKGNESIPAILSKAAKRIDRPFLVASYNSFTYERFIESLLKESETNPDQLILVGAQLTLSPQAVNYYAILEDRKVVEIVNQKPAKDISNYVLAELVVCGQHFLDYIKNMDDKKASGYGKNLFQMIHQYVSTDEAQTFVDETSWILAVESDKDLLTLNKRLLEDSNDSHILSELPYTARVIPPVRIDPQVSVGQGVVIGPHVYVERGSSIGYGAKIKNALILERSNVASDANIDGGIVTRNGVIKL
jgi:NDP-sugar pyrophosphorylase family protein